MTPEQTVQDVAEILTNGLWCEAASYFDGSTALEEDVRACWKAAVDAQRCAAADFQMPEPFAGYGGVANIAPSLLVVGSNPGFKWDQDFPRWRDVRGPTGARAYFDYFWHGFDPDHRGGHLLTGAPLAWSRDRTWLWPIRHYWDLEAVLGAGALSGRAWEVDALPWKGSCFKTIFKKCRATAERIAQHRVAQALGAIEPDAAGNRRILVLGDDAAALLGLSPKRRHDWQPLTVLNGAAVSHVSALVTYHPSQRRGYWVQRSLPILHDRLRL